MRWRKMKMYLKLLNPTKNLSEIKVQKTKMKKNLLNNPKPLFLIQIKYLKLMRLTVIKSNQEKEGK